jgi:glycosyltransferase involved in cell wall biosynthesis
VTPIHLAANRGDIGGGEVMLLRLAGALGLLGYDVTVVAPSTPGDLAAGATAQGLAVQEIACHDRRSYAQALRRWDRGRRGLLWCQGLLPALATAGRRHRVVHLHQEPLGGQRPLAAVARRGALATIVPSEFMRSRLAGAEVLTNWTDDLSCGQGARGEPAELSDDVTVGYLGRIGREKGAHVLATACALLRDDVRTRVRLVLAGDDRFVPEADRAVVSGALAEAERVGVRVQRIGWVEPSDFFSQVDLAAFPSVRAESFGLVVAEAMAAGVPFVISDAGALPEVAGPDHPFVVPHDDAPALAMALGAAIADLPAADLTAKMRQRWEDLYSPAAGLRSVTALMERLAHAGAVDARPAQHGELP